MKDFLGNELEIGDDVIYARYKTSTKVRLEAGVVLRFTPKRVVLLCDHSYNGETAIMPIMLYKI